MKNIMFLHQFDRKLGVPILKRQYVIDYFKHKEVNPNLPAPMYASIERESEKHKIKLSDCKYMYCQDYFTYIEETPEIIEFRKCIQGVNYE